MRLSTLSWRAVGGLFLGRIACTKTPSTNSWDATRTWKRWPQFFTQVSRTWGPVRPYTTWKTTVILSVLYAQAERHCRGNRTGGTSETLKTAGNKKKWRWTLHAVHPRTHSKSQHNLSEVLVSYDSLPNCFDWIFGSGKKGITSVLLFTTKWSIDKRFKECWWDIEEHVLFLLHLITVKLQCVEFAGI